MNRPVSSDLLRHILRDVSRSFYLTLRVLPSRVREPIGLAYLLARTTDTIADTEIVPPGERLEALRRLRRRISGADTEPLRFEALAKNQSSKAERVLLERVEEALGLLRHTSEFDRAQIVKVLNTITTGQEQDLERFGIPAENQVRALTTEAELEDYTYKVAGCVGEFWTNVCRFHLFQRADLNQAALIDQGIRFGKGLQLVNILRDVAADLRNGRCYLPRQQITTAGLSPSDLLSPSAYQQLRPVYEQWLGKAETYLRDGWAYTNSLPWSQMRVRLACAWPLLIGFETLGLLRLANPLDPAQRVKIPRSHVRKILFHSLVYYPFPGLWRGLGVRAGQARPVREA